MSGLRSFLQRALPLLAAFVYGLAVSLGVFTGGLWATLGIGGAVLLFLGVVAMDGKMPAPAKSFSHFAFAVLLVFAAELPLSPHGALSLKVWLNLVSTFLPLLLLTAPRLQSVAFSKSFVPVVAAATAIGAVALGAELSSGGYLLHALKKPNASLTEYNRGIAHVVILVFPLLAGLWISGKRKQAGALALTLLFPTSLTESHTAKLALIVGLACAAFAFYRPTWVRRGLALGLIALAGWPFYAQHMFSTAPELVAKLHDSWRHRLEIWDFLSYRIAERPVFGWGLGTTPMLDFTKPHGEMYRFAVQAAPHAHNFIVELWVETGLLGLVIGIVFLLWTLRRIGRLQKELQPFALACFAAAVTVCMFGFNFWTDALWAAFALSAFVFGMLERQGKGGEDIVRI